MPKKLPLKAKKRPMKNPLKMKKQPLMPKKRPTKHPLKAKRRPTKRPLTTKRPLLQKKRSQTMILSRLLRPTHSRPVVNCVKWSIN
jgi:hypothetical protein